LIVQIGIFPPGEPGISIRASYDPDLPPQLLGYEIGLRVHKAMKRPAKRKPKEAPAA
jgi:hypothetical protein